MEKRTEVKTVKVELVCESCSEGTMELCRGMGLTTIPFQYPHKCTDCGAEMQVTGTTYPYMEYK